MINRIISILIIAFIALSSVIFFLIALIIWLTTVSFDRRLVLLHLYTSFWASVYIWIVPAWSVKIKGRERINRYRKYIIVSNHQSQLDILAAFGLFTPFKWVAKAEAFNLPFIGWNMTLNRYIKLKRGDRESAGKMMADCEKALSHGNSVYFFPEGTRSESGIMKPFKPGAFILAKKLKIPILPIVINGAKNALPKHSLNVHGRHKIRLTVLDEIPYKSFAGLTIDETAEMARSAISIEVDEHKRLNET